jgi:transaldolase
MKIFIDSADTLNIASCVRTELVDGVTTNPTLIKKSGRNPHDVYEELVALHIPDISMEVKAGDSTDMIDEAMQLYTLYKDVSTIKLPMTTEGLIACKHLSEIGIKTNVTLIFNAAQAILAAKAGATYVSPFVGRIDDQGYAGLEVVRSIADLYARHRMDTNVLAASIRSPHRAVRSFYNGAGYVTMPPSVFWKMYEHILTEKGLAIFEEDALSHNKI